MTTCLLCSCLLHFNENDDEPEGFCSEKCKAWYDAWIQFPPDARPSKIAYYLGRKYSVDQKFFHEVQ